VYNFSLQARNEKILENLAVRLTDPCPTMKVQLSQLPKIVGFGARHASGALLFFVSSELTLR
jgi:hypothetical protein